jgi:CheY-like chemotaxis protein
MSSKRTVLHVDDDPAVLEVSSDWADVHDEVDWLTTSDPGTGLELLATRRVDCLVSDSFRAADGTPFVTRVTDTVPGLPVVLFTSMEHDALDPAVRTSDAAYVRKGSAEPFDALLDRVLAVTGDADHSPATVDPALRELGDAGDAGDDSTPTGQWVPIGRYRPADGEDPATAIITAVEAYTGLDAAAFPPLYDAVDADALAALLAEPDDPLREHVRVRFVYADHELAVTGGGLVLVLVRSA